MGKEGVRQTDLVPLHPLCLREDRDDALEAHAAEPGGLLDLAIRPTLASTSSNHWWTLAGGAHLKGLEEARESRRAREVRDGHGKLWRGRGGVRGAAQGRKCFLEREQRVWGRRRWRRVELRRGERLKFRLESAGRRGRDTREHETKASEPVVLKPVGVLERADAVLDRVKRGRQARDRLRERLLHIRRRTGCPWN